MRILTISDTHGDLRALTAVLLLHPEAEIVIHCGDGERELNTFLQEHREYMARCYHVKGNCDFCSISPTELTLDLPFGHRLIAVHGHEHLYHGETGLVRLAQRESADLVLFGHLHCRTDFVMDGVRIFSPGSASRPRDGKAPAYGLIDLQSGGMVVNHGEVPRSIG